MENVPKVRYRKIKFMTKKEKSFGKIYFFGKESELLAVRRLQGNKWAKWWAGIFSYFMITAVAAVAYSINLYK